MEILNSLGVNWQLLLAQIINFGIILFILARFVYKPILRVIDDRRQVAKKAIEDAKHIENQRRETDAFRIEQLKKIDAECAEFLARAKQEAERSKAEILASAKTEAEQVMIRAQRALDEERERAAKELQDTVAGIVVRATEKILRREFKPEDQKRIVADLAATVSTELTQ